MCTHSEFHLSTTSFSPSSLIFASRDGPALPIKARCSVLVVEHNTHVSGAGLSFMPYYAN